MVVGAIGGRTEIAIIGSGPGGYVAALRAADAGFEVTLIERGHLGGTCLNVGCIPSKTLIETAALRHAAVASSDRGITASVEIDMGRVAGHLDAVSTRLRSGVEQLLADAGVTVVAGTASFARYDRVSIEHDGGVHHLDFDHAIIATGSRPIELPSLPFGAEVLDSTAALQLRELPDRLAVIGAGYIGVELGTAFAKLGVDVTIVEARNHVLPDLPAQLRRPVARRLGELGVTVLTGERARRHADGTLELDSGRAVGADRVVVAVGRRPNGDRCSADVAGVTVLADGTIEVDEQLRAARNIYAIGDVVAGPALAHRATHDAERVIALLRGEPHPGPAVIPAVIFSDPEVLSVGVWADDAETSGLFLHRFPHAANARALTMSAASGATWLVTDPAGTVLGVHAVGPHVSELAGEAVLAIEMAATVDDLRHSVHPHPTIGESVAEAAWLAHGSPLHVRR